MCQRTIKMSSVARMPSVSKCQTSKHYNIPNKLCYTRPGTVSTNTEQGHAQKRWNIYCITDQCHIISWQPQQDLQVVGLF